MNPAGMITHALRGQVKPELLTQVQYIRLIFLLYLCTLSFWCIPLPVLPRVFLDKITRF